MAAFPDARQIFRAQQRAREALGLAGDARLGSEEAGVFLKYLLLEGMNAGGGSERQKGAGRRRVLAALQKALIEEPSACHAAPAAILALASDPLYRSRLLDLAEEALLSEPLAPEICLHPEPLAPGSGHRHAVIFASAGFAHEFYPLAVDAHVRDSLRYGAPRIRLLGVREDWLDPDGTIGRAICLDPERNRLAEADLSAPVVPDSIQFLCLGEREQALQRDLAGRFACPQVNPYAPSALADDKAATLAGWSALGLEVPRFLRVGPGRWEDARAFIACCTETVVKPNGASEGKGIRYVSRTDRDKETRLASALECCWREGAALVQERRDGVMFRDPERGSLHTLALRLNLVHDCRGYRVASGYVQIGADAGQPASRGRGGRILALGRVLPHLAARRDGGLSVPGPDLSLWCEIERQAKQAAGLFGNLLLVGLDVLLGLDARGRIEAVFLEANPRPAGLCHSRLLSGLPSPADQSGVGPALWDGLEFLCQTRVACKP